ncbi:MAG: TIGR02530 family flagellar biosynthesis protein [Anaerolineaceae bacterium]
MTEPIRIDTSIQPVSPKSPSSNQARVEGQTFADVLAQKTAQPEAQALKFSNHAQKRLETRDINLTDDGLARLAMAVDKADKRGARESLVLMDEMAFIVNVKDRIVVTAMDANQRGEGVFTQIDSVVLADKAK